MNEEETIKTEKVKITFNGEMACGKSTILNIVKKHLEQLNYKVDWTFLENDGHDIVVHNVFKKEKI